MNAESNALRQQLRQSRPVEEASVAGRIENILKKSHALRIENLKKFQALVQDNERLILKDGATADQRNQHEAELNKLLSLATDLAYIYPKETYELWTKHVPASEPVPPVLKAAYDRLTDEQKASKENALQAAADQEARDENLHAVLGHAVERFMAKYPSEKDFPGFVKEESQGAFYVEIVQVFKEQDFPNVSRDDLLPTQEDVLALTRFLDQHNDPAQRAELERLGAEHARKAHEITTRNEAVSDAREEAIKLVSIDSEAYQKQTDNRERSAMITNMAANVNSNPHYREALEQLAPAIGKAIDERNEAEQRINNAAQAQMGRTDEPNQKELEKTATNTTDKQANAQQFTVDGKEVSHKDNFVPETESAESDALMQQFRQAVYDRLTNPEMGRKMSPEGGIERRSILFANWSVTARKNREPDELAPDLVRHWVVADVASFRAIPTERQDIAANDLFRNMSANSSYAETLKSVDERIFTRIKVLNAANEQKVRAKEERKRHEYEALKRERESLLEETVEARKRLEKLLPSDWNGKVFVETIKDPTGDIFDIRAERTGDAGSTHIAFMDSSEQATTLVSRFHPIAERWFKPIVQEANGFASRSTTDNETPTDKSADPEPLVSKVLESVTYKTQRDGSVLYMLSNRPAFVDHGQQILMDAKADEDEEAILAAVLLAKEKYGGAFELTGSEEFKRRAIEIMLKHEIDVKLKNPQQDALRRELAKERAGAADDQPKEKDKETLDKPVIGKPAKEAPAPVALLAGVLLEHGKAKFNFDKDEKDSYFAKYRDDAGEEKIVWGVDLARAMKESKAEVGQRIELENKGRQPVTVNAPVRNEEGTVVGYEKKETHRNAWEVTAQHEKAKEAALLEDSEKAAKVGVTTAQATTASSSPDAAPQEPAPGPFAADLIPVRALDWWSVQRDAIHTWAKNNMELQADLQQLGPEPSADQVYWFDKSGRQCDPPADASTYLSQVKTELPGFVSGTSEELHVRDAKNSTDSSAKVVSDINQKELTMAATAESMKNQEPPLILRGVKKLDSGEFDTTVLLFKGKGDYLQGYIKIGDQKRHVLAHLNERKPNQETGEVKPNYFKLSEPHGQGDDTTWKEIGFGNAVNHRKDGKPVYHDEVLFSVGNEMLKARITKHVDDEMHRQLGFLEPRKPRPSNENKSATTPGDALPKAAAPAARTKEDAAGAPKARRSSRAKA